MIKKFIFLSFLFIGGLLIFSFIFWNWANKPIDPNNNTDRDFIIPKGQSANAIANRLQTQKLIKNSLVFKLSVKYQNLSDKLQAGYFKLSKSMTMNEIATALTHGSSDLWITFPEGLRVEEYASKLAKKFNINEQQFIIDAKVYEGSLFPDTYLIPKTASNENIIELLTNTFSKKVPTINKKQIIIASLIERETKHEKDKAIVSSVIHNRLKINMSIQIDATIQYLLGTKKNWWPKDLTIKDLKINSPYNTYLNRGLPPAPIANPGEASLKAAISPAKTNYLYYVSDSAGYNHYAEDLDGHNKNIQKYLNNK